MSLTLKTVPSTEPISTAEAKAHLRVTIADEDTYIGVLITSARLQVEKYLRQALVTQTWELRLDDFPSSDGTELYVAMLPLISVSSISYVDTDGDTQTWSSDEYTVDKYSAIPRIVPAYSYSWPSTRDQINAITITFTAGYGNASDVPEDIKSAIKLIIGEMYENREESVVGTIVSKMPKTAMTLLNLHQAKTLGF